MADLNEQATIEEVNATYFQVFTMEIRATEQTDQGIIWGLFSGSNCRLRAYEKQTLIDAFFAELKDGVRKIAKETATGDKFKITITRTTPRAD